MRLTLYVPDKGNNGESGNEALENAIVSLSKAYGGATTYPAFGHWVDNGGNLISEPVHVIETYAQDGQAIETLQNEAKAVKAFLSQDAVAYTVDNALFLV